MGGIAGGHFCRDDSWVECEDHRARMGAFHFDRSCADDLVECSLRRAIECPAAKAIVANLRDAGRQEGGDGAFDAGELRREVFENEFRCNRVQRELPHHHIWVDLLE